jgi:hypothetical protein
MPDGALFRIEQRHASVNVADVMDRTVNVLLVNGSAAELTPE